MSHDTIENEIVKTAQKIGFANVHEELFDSQFSFWLSLQSLMKSGGYEEVRKRMAFVSEELAEAVGNASLKSIRNICSDAISTIRPSLPDSTLKAMLASQPHEDINARMVLQLLSDQTETHHG